MNFKGMSESYFSGTQAERDQATIEYKSSSGYPISRGVTSEQVAFTAKGNGELEYFRRGDFMERADAYPGVWRSKCPTKDLETAWDKLGDLNTDSFQTRVADPGDPISSISAFFPNRVEVITWGPPDHSKKSPGNAFLTELSPLMGFSDELPPVWGVEMVFSKIAVSMKTVSIELTFNNPGTSPIGICLGNPDGQNGFALRHALDRDVAPGVTPLPVEWTWCKLDIPDRKSELLWNLAPGKPLTLMLQADLELSPQNKYMGKIQYQQLRHLDFLAGNPILSGSCFTEVFEFQA